MKLVAFILLILLSVGCSTGLKRSSFFYTDPASYDVICADQAAPKHFSYFINSTINSRSGSSVQLRDAKGNLKWISPKGCIFERSVYLKASLKKDLSPRTYQIICKIGDAQFMDSNMQKLDEDANSLYMRRLDGKVWIVSKALCPLLEQMPELGD
jgi:hypothetical protein